MSVLLLIITFLFLMAGIFLFIKRYKDFPGKEGAESIWTKDFFMLIGSLVLALSAFQITMTTSIPIWNKLFGLHIAPPLDPVKFYNSWQIQFTGIVLVLVASLQYLYYYKREKKSILIQFASAFIFSIIVTILMAVYTDYHQLHIVILFLAVILAVSFSFVSLFHYKERKATPGSLITHLGFAIFVLGVLLAFSNSRVITNVNQGSGPDKLSGQQEGSVLLFRDNPVKLDEYFAVYSKRTAIGSETFYQIDFYKDAIRKDKLFSLYPSIKQNEKMGTVFNPSTRNFIEKDVYTFVSHAELFDADNDTTGENNIKSKTEVHSGAINLNNYNLVSKPNIALKQQLIIGQFKISLDSIWLDIKDKAYKDVDIMAGMNVIDSSNVSHKVVCVFMKRGDQYFNKDGVIKKLGLALRFEMTAEKQNNIQLGIYKQKVDFIVLKAIIFPWMNVLWLGALIMLAGLIVSLYKRLAPMRI
jgi:cytochrome c-type biogenesis protein CcmF